MCLGTLAQSSRKTALADVVCWQCPHQHPSLNQQHVRRGQYV